MKHKYEYEQEQMQSPNISFINQLKQGSYSSSTRHEDIDNLLEKIFQTNRHLIDCSDGKTQAILEKEWNDLQKSVNEIELHLKQRTETLLSVS